MRLFEPYFCGQGQQNSSEFFSVCQHWKFGSKFDWFLSQQKHLGFCVYWELGDCCEGRKNESSRHNGFCFVA